MNDCFIGKTGTLLKPWQKDSPAPRIPPNPLFVQDGEVAKPRGALQIERQSEGEERLSERLNFNKIAMNG